MEWKPAWHYQMIRFGESLADLTNFTQLLSFRATVDGSKLRLLLDNRYNTGVMIVGKVRVKAGTEITEATVNGEGRIVLLPNQTVHTDDVFLSVKTGETVCVEMEFESAAGICGICQTWAARSWKTRFFTGEGKEVVATTLLPWLQNDVHEPTAAIGISQIDVCTKKHVQTIAMFGDSITHMSYYSDALQERILSEIPGRAVIANTGIGGNRLCYEASYSPDLGIHSSVFGDAGFRRFERDVFETMNPETVLIMEGINDITHCFQYGRPDQIPTIELLCRRYEEVIDCAHYHGAKVYIATIMPENVFREESWYLESECLRMKLNQWIKTQSKADGVIDFDAVAQDVEDPGRMKDGFHMDGLHPNEFGGKEMAVIVPLYRMICG